MITTIISGIVSIGIGFFSGIRIIRPTEKGLHERFGKYIGTKEQGFNWIIPLVDRMRIVNITEQMVDVPEQIVITKDDLNAKVDAVVYFRVKDCFKAKYKADDYVMQITSLARTTLRAIVGKMSLKDANNQRDVLNQELEKALDKQTNEWGIDIVRVELQEILPPKKVVEAMNDVVVSEREKISATNRANALENEADGIRRSSIKKAEGEKQSEILKAEGQAISIKLVNESAEKYFKGKAKELKQLEVTEEVLKNNTTYVIDPNSKITNVISNMSGVVPITKKS